jgi:2-oxoglutarate/2-oxoacid ferredoxin oxidoreductase subunit alpha
MAKPVEELTDVVIRFADDSGTGMQVSGDQFATASALFGNDLSTLPDFPAEIRAPAGTLAGISSFQVRFSSADIHTPGDDVDVLVAMNPAALKVSLPLVRANGIILVNTAGFSAKNLRLADYETNPLEDNSLDRYQVFPIDLVELTKLALAEFTELSSRETERAKNMFGLGIVFWLFHRPLEHTIEWIRSYFDRPGREKFIEPNIEALKAGYVYAEATELFATSYEVRPAPLREGTYRNINGNAGIVMGLIAASKKSGLPLFYAGYPITPASQILHELSQYRHVGVKTVQCEDEIAAMGAAIGGAYGGALSITASSGPGIALKQEALSLGIMMELPLVIVNVQRGGPSTGLPTKTEQSDLFQAICGRHGESPVPVLATARPADCFDVAYAAARIAVKYMTPVIVLSDGYLGNGTEPWRIPDADALEPIPVKFHTEVEGFLPFGRDPETLARPWAVPGTPGLQHRVGGLEKADGSGNVSYDAVNHEVMTHHRANKVALVANEIPPTEVHGPDEGDVLILGWGGTYGSIRAATERLQADGLSVARAHIRWLNPLPSDIGDVMKRYKRVLLPELNLGQLSTFLRSKYLVDVQSLNKMRGAPFTSSEIEDAARELI